MLLPRNYFFVIATQLIAIGSHLRLSKQEILEKPLITMKYDGEGWVFVSPKNDSVLSEIDPVNPGLGSQITLECTAPYPIQWRVQGYRGEEIFRTGATKTEIRNNGQQWMYTIETWNGFPAPASAKVSCIHFKIPSTFSSISVFVSNKSSVFLQNVRKIHPIGKIVPCPVVDPRVAVLLFRKTTQSRNGIVQIEANYDPTVGFIFDTDQEGEFICRTREYNKDIILEDADKNNLQVVKTEFWLTDEIVSLRCNASTGDITSEAIKTTEFLSGIKTLNYTVNPKKMDIVLDGSHSGNSTFTCQNELGTRKTFLNYWFIHAPKLRFNTLAGEIDCISESRNKSIAGVRCENPNDCFLLRDCFHDIKCKNDRQTYFLGEVNDLFCPSANDASCISIRTTFFNGLVECGVANRSRNVIFQFFSGLRLIKYQTWKEAPKEELIRMDEIPSVLYANDTSEFLCEAVAFLFTDSFHYSITYSNGSRIFLSSESYSMESSPRKIQDFNLISSIKISLPIEAIELTCHNSLADEQIIFNTSRKFVVKYLKHPEIDKSVKKIQLIRGTEGRLACKASGEPLPDIKMEKLESNEIFHHIKTTTDGQAFLEFEKVDYSMAGKYLCTAMNRLNNDTFIFEVTVVESRETTLYAVILGTLAVICLLLVVSLYFWRQQKFARDLLRQLTEEEIDEFLNGNKDMWILSQNNPNKQENIHYMPYNNDYEIPIHKLELDETCLLGSGEYGMIVRASYDQNYVAVKTTKPVADILYFKALLSELKVMMFIGQQENIVRLIGACTENIRDRKIYIVFELCSLGNLEKYLQENRKYFIGEEMDNTEDKITKPDRRYENQVLTTSDFIRWSYEVACAMEWLSLKKVVHADLAARNILLTENKMSKLSDFGLSLKLYQDTNYVKRKQVPLPFRWMAIESLKQLKFSTESDIWSYGVTVWEMFSFGDVPFPGQTWDYLFVSGLTDGLRLQKPKQCPQQLYDNILMNCWQLNPNERPSFTIIKNYFDKTINTNQEPVYSNAEEIEMSAIMINETNTPHRDI